MVEFNENDMVKVNGRIGKVWESNPNWLVVQFDGGDGHYYYSTFPQREFHALEKMIDENNVRVTRLVALRSTPFSDLLAYVQSIRPACVNLDKCTAEELIDDILAYEFGVNQ